MGKPDSALISEDFLVFALREGSKISEEKNPHYPVLKPPKKQGLFSFISAEPLKSLEKRGKRSKKDKEILAREKNKEQGIPKKNQGKEGQGN